MKVIEKHIGSWYIEIYGRMCKFSLKPISLYLENNLFPLVPNCDNGLRWKVNNKWVSYNQIKNEINKP